MSGSGLLANDREVPYLLGTPPPDAEQYRPRGSILIMRRPAGDVRPVPPPSARRMLGADVQCDYGGVDTFSLLPEEHATLGVTHRGDRLKLRPTAQVFAHAGMFAIFGCMLPVIGLSLNGPALILVALGAVLLVRAGLTAAAVVVADSEHVTIRNRSSRKRIPIEHIGSVATDHRHFPFGKAPYSNFWAGPKYLLVGYVTERPGRRVYCDVATSPPSGHTMLDRAGLGALAPGSDAPTSAEVKMAALNRWVTVHQVGPGSSAPTAAQS